MTISDKPILCEHCGGNGEVVTDRDAYLGHGQPIADAVAECEPCCGTGYTDYAAHLDLGSAPQSTSNDE